MNKRMLAVSFFGVLLTPVLYYMALQAWGARRRAARSTGAYTASPKEGTHA